MKWRILSSILFFVLLSSFRHRSRGFPLVWSKSLRNRMQRKRNPILQPPPGSYSVTIADLFLRPEGLRFLFPFFFHPVPLPRGVAIHLKIPSWLSRSMDACWRVAALIEFLALLRGRAEFIGSSRCWGICGGVGGLDLPQGACLLIRAGGPLAIGPFGPHADRTGGGRPCHDFANCIICANRESLQNPRHQ